MPRHPKTERSIQITASFMALGLREHTNTQYRTLLDHWDGGEWELIDEVTGYARYCEGLWQAGYDLGLGPVGVWDYDVAEAFGMWYASTLLERPAGEPLPTAECFATLRLLAEEYYQPDERPDWIAQLPTVLATVPEVHE